MNTRLILILPLLNLFSSGCGILVGNVKPVSDRANHRAYVVMDLAEDNSDWKLIEVKSSNDSEENSAGQADIAYQSQTSHAIISLNSACRESNRNRDLKAHSQLLMGGVQELKDKEETFIEINQHPALQTTLLGLVNGEEMKLRTIVVKKDACVYDLLYITRPLQFEKQESDFQKFSGSLKVNDQQGKRD